MSSGRMDKVVGRFAPSPSGRMHAGNIFASLMSWLVAKSHGGDIVLRIEDLDIQRSKREFIEAIPRDYEMLGLTWDRGPFFQHDRTEAYEAAFSALEEQGLIYPCFCSRAEIIASAPHHGEKSVYAGTCRGLSHAERARRALEKSPGYRIEAREATIALDDAVQGRYSQNLAQECGDFLLKRADGAFAYQLAVVVDDAAQGVTSVVRGVDLLCSTPQQIYLQRLLGFAQPSYAHIPLLVSTLGKRLSKRDRSASLDEMLAVYDTAQGVLGHIAYVTGLIDADEPISAEGLLMRFDPDNLSQLFADPIQVLWRS